MKYVKEFGVFIDNNCNIYSTDHKGKIYALPWSQGGRNGAYYKIAYYPVNENWDRLPHTGKQRKAFVHRIIATAFVPNTDNKQTVDHINRDSHNNNPGNLRWATQSEQQRNRSTSDVCKQKTGVYRYENPKMYSQLYKRYRRQHKEAA